MELVILRGVLGVIAVNPYKVTKVNPNFTKPEWCHLTYDSGITEEIHDNFHNVITLLSNNKVR